MLAAEATARTGRDPGESYRALNQEFGEPFYDRVDAPATPEEKAVLARLSPEQINLTALAGERIQTILTRAPGNNAPLGGVKVMTANGWFAARPSGTEDIYKIYAESFQSEAQLRKILEEAQTVVSAAAASKSTGKSVPALSPPPHEQTKTEAVEVWENEGDPN
jgi:phosphoglucomutase